MNGNTRVKECPLRKRCHEGVRHYGSDTWFGCIYPEGDSGRSDHDVTCTMHGSSLIKKCKIYNEWSEKQVRDAFKKLDEVEAHRDAVMEVMRL